MVSTIKQLVSEMKPLLKQGCHYRLQALALTLNTERSATPIKAWEKPITSHRVDLESRELCLYVDGEDKIITITEFAGYLKALPKEFSNFSVVVSEETSVDGYQVRVDSETIGCGSNRAAKLWSVIIAENG